ncbi:grasp-with-spasm system SPASM domain peptide maturase [Mucilaginibacter paludis]|uniref:4Fe4S-binding SPASM domain-containing protein n=1 Tax=Mucilaginibacter paludis DSM 18603 TaxID=714943 RepID=H1Y1N4_9SPHI|nr:grasp-with-spasm system SPASM domain peptide maturase [Mucilaginibacter paludis]EHQ24693.1 hypothetical protein Mucpa_0500 [Mucilaginibacter paludis DSM 18603]
MSKMTLYASCIPVKGAVRSTICDLQRTTYEIIPNSMYDFLVYYNGKSINEIKNDFSIEDQVIVDEYIDFLLKKEYIFFSDFPNNFPPISLDWDSPCLITNAIVDFDAASNHNFKKIVDQLSFLRCQALELRFFDVVNLNFIKGLILQTKNSSLRYINLVIKYDSLILEEDIKDLLAQNTVLTHVLFHSCPKPVFTELATTVFSIDTIISDETHCGVISEYNFSVNITSFTESVNFNSCLNRKISIDKRGEIKNCPSLPNSFGNINDISLNEIVNQSNFTRVWQIKKDSINVCKDCEFRYICTDCRAYVSDLYAKPIKCHYDPYNPSGVIN